MEKQEPVDQRRRAVRQFIVRYEQYLRVRGTIVPTWRRRGARRVGPYFLLVVRDGTGRQHAVYLGGAGSLLDDVRHELLGLQAIDRDRRLLARVRRQMRVELARAKRQLDSELTQFGLYRKGHEIRGWAQLPVTVERPVDAVQDRHPHAKG